MAVTRQRRRQSAAAEKELQNIHSNGVASRNGSAKGRAHYPTVAASTKYDALYAILLLAIAISTALSVFLHNRLPVPVAATDDVTRFSEGNAMKHVQVLAGDIGYRIVGTAESIQAENYILGVLDEYKRTAAGIEGTPDFEIIVQNGDGQHRFDFMSKVVMKRYINITNIIVRLGGNDKPATLYNAHLDSTLPSPGAADDALPVGVMLETIRIMSRSTVERKNAAIFLFNNGEESLQDASHLFSTQSDLVSPVRQVINLEAAGVRGREILFQANSETIVRAYSKVPHPHGSAMANDLFMSGFVLSDTDFRQFVQYGNMTGIDMALYKGSYLYHTFLDNPEHIQPGAAQHMGDNVLALAEYLSAEADLPDETPSTDLVFFDLHGLWFFVYQWETARMIQLAIVAIASSMVIAKVRSMTSIIVHAFSLISIFVGLVVGLLFASLLAVVMVNVVGKSLSWFPYEVYPVLLFGPPTIFGVLLTQYVFGIILPQSYLPENVRHHLEIITYDSTLLFLATLLGVGTFFEIKSSFLPLVLTSGFLVGHLVNRYLTPPGASMSIVAYLFAQVPASMLMTDAACAVLDLFVPLTGRIGPQAPVDNIIAVLVSGLTTLLLPTLPALAHRLGAKRLGRAILLLVGLPMIASFVYFSFFAFPYRIDKPKRVFVQHQVNITSGDRSLHVGFADKGYEDDIIRPIEKRLMIEGIRRTAEEATDDWLSLYPFSQFVVNYRFDLPRPANPNLTGSKISIPWLDVDRSEIVTSSSVPSGTGRKVTLRSDAQSLIWPVITFGAHLQNWSIPSPPAYADESAKYYIKQAGGHGNTQWQLDLDIQGQEKVTVHYQGIEEEGFWQYKEREGQNRVDVLLLRQVEELLPEWVTGMFLSTVTGVYEV